VRREELCGALMRDSRLGCLAQDVPVRSSRRLMEVNACAGHDR